MGAYIPPGRRFAILDRAFKYRLGEKADQLGLTAVQLRVLGELSRLEASGVPEVNQRDLEIAEQVTHPTMTDMIRRLEKKGFVTCSVSQTDRRYKKINCTKRSAHLYKELAQEDERIFDKICAGLSDEDRQNLLRITGHMLKNLGYPVEEQEGESHMTDYKANAGQTFLPVQDNTDIDTLPYEPLPRPEPAFPPLSLNPMAREKKWVLQSQNQHFLPGVSAAMLDWFWANMEKGYYLWAPGSHKRFSWVKSPWQYGFIHSVHKIAESVGKGNPVFGGEGVEIHRLDLSYFPFTYALDHVLVEGVFNDRQEFVDMTVHMWQDCEGGCHHITAAVASTTVSKPPSFVKEILQKDPHAKLVPPSTTDHAEYEASRWPQFLPALYRLWEGHPDPSQNVPCNLTVKKTGDYEWQYRFENPAIVPDKA